MAVTTGVFPDPPDDGMAAWMMRAAGAAWLVRAAVDPAIDLSDDQREKATFRGRGDLNQAIVALGELIPVLLIRSQAGACVDELLAEVDAIGPTGEGDAELQRLLLPLVIVAVRIRAVPGPPDTPAHLWLRLDERLAQLEGANSALHRSLRRAVEAALEQIRAQPPPGSPH